ncbi:hypothetical protein PGT21_024902 [Puccinia graminis f. sp. tritici]|uniref:Uncharacterized protein n=1 Tax=Puccinia graminis f. sp. tritici TaxID=56615 RepID=A0A5B0RP53_PUCGR|nr:hypothetical protein PGT21_024902 [Puccinia graminis f. sp. tritici]KAA1127726.1 hypothetical protein PGTUg99_005128 [Puccinia graminis f. sp. tritici]
MILVRWHRLESYDPGKIPEGKDEDLFLKADALFLMFTFWVLDSTDSQKLEFRLQIFGTLLRGPPIDRAQDVLTP